MLKKLSPGLSAMVRSLTNSGLIRTAPFFKHTSEQFIGEVLQVGNWLPPAPPPAPSRPHCLPPATCHLPLTVHWGVPQMLRLVLYAPGEMIICEGDIAQEMYFIKQGKVEIFINVSKKSICFIESGEHFGEVACMFAQRRGARSAPV